MAYIRGDANSNRLYATPDRDTIDGGEGSDVVDYSASTGAVSVTLDAAEQSGGDAEGDVLISIANVTGSASDDKIVGDKYRNRLDGGKGADYLDGGDGNDNLQGGDGDDTLIGGDGNDDMLGDEGNDALNGGDGNDNLKGGVGNDTLLGGEGDDKIVGGIGNDTVDGGNGNDIMSGGVGNDTLNGGNGIDTVHYSASEKAVKVVLDYAVQSGGDAEGDVLISIENVTGSSYDDTIVGNKYDNILSGGDGLDYLDGGYGNDVLMGRNDGFVDVLVGGDGIDTVDYSDAAHYIGSARPLTVNLEEGTTIARPVANYVGAVDIKEDVLSGIENVVGSSLGDAITGDAGANRLDGAAGNDTISGGDGADIIVGGDGTDVMRGFNGSITGIGDRDADTFVFNSAAEIGIGASKDIIRGFEFGIDKMDFSGIDANVNAAGDQAFHFVLGGFSGNAGDLFVVETTSGGDDFSRVYSIFADTDGNAQADFELQVSGSNLLNRGILSTLDFIA